MRRFSVKVNNVVYEVEVEEKPSGREELAEEIKAPEPAKINRPENQFFSGTNALKVPMPGMIAAVNIVTGQSVKKGELLFVLQSVNTRNNIVSGENCVIASVLIRQGQSVNAGDIAAYCKKTL